MFSQYFWHSEGWTPRNGVLLEAVVKQANTTRHPWLVACGASMCPEDIEKSLLFRTERMHVVAPKKVSTFGRKVHKVSGSNKPMTTSLRAMASEENFHRWKWWKTLSQGRTKQCSLWLKGKEITEMD